MKPANKSKTIRDEKIKAFSGLILGAVGIFKPELLPALTPAIAGAVMVADAMRGIWRRYKTTDPIER